MAKVFLSILIISLLFIFGNFLQVQADSECPAGQICNPLKYDTFEKILGAISGFIFQIAMVLAPVMLIIAGFFFVTAAGDPKRVETGKHIILYTLIGLAIILLASGLIKVLESILGVEGT